jgi:hypothetical protein
MRRTPLFKKFQNQFFAKTNQSLQKPISTFCRFSLSENYREIPTVNQNHHSCFPPLRHFPPPFVLIAAAGKCRFDKIRDTIKGPWNTFYHRKMRHYLLNGKNEEKIYFKITDGGGGGGGE